MKAGVGFLSLFGGLLLSVQVFAGPGRNCHEFLSSPPAREAESRIREILDSSELQEALRYEGDRRVGQIGRDLLDSIERYARAQGVALIRTADEDGTPALLITPIAGVSYWNRLAKEVFDTVGAEVWISPELLFRLGAAAVHRFAATTGHAHLRAPRIYLSNDQLLKPSPDASFVHEYVHALVGKLDLLGYENTFEADVSNRVEYVDGAERISAYDRFHHFSESAAYGLHAAALADALSRSPDDVRIQRELQTALSNGEALSKDAAQAIRKALKLLELDPKRLKRQGRHALVTLPNGAVLRTPVYRTRSTIERLEGFALVMESMGQAFESAWTYGLVYGRTGAQDDLALLSSRVRALRAQILAGLGPEAMKPRVKSLLSGNLGTR